MSDSNLPSNKIDPRQSLAIGNAINKLCKDRNCNLTPKVRANMKRRVERRIAAGEPGDVVFGTETMSIKQNR